MAKVTVGSLSTFNHEVQEWAIYKDRLEQWFLANELEEAGDKSGAKRRAILLSSLTETTYKLVRDLALPAVVANLSYADVVKLLDEHFQSKKCGFAERYTFHTAVQYANESMAEWAARVRSLAAHCEFSAEAFGDLLRDRFVLGMVHGPERDKLFTTNMNDVTFKKALEIAEGMRSARLGSQRGQQASMSTSEAHIPLQVLKMSTGAARSSGSEGQPRALRRPGAVARTQAAADGAGARGASCEVCGYAGHGADSCRFKHHVCKRCGVRGHLKRMCMKGVSRQYYVECDADDDVVEVNGAGARDGSTGKGSAGGAGGWSVTVAGSCRAALPADVEMRLRFPRDGRDARGPAPPRAAAARAAAPPRNDTDATPRRSVATRSDETGTTECWCRCCSCGGAGAAGAPAGPTAPALPPPRERRPSLAFTMRKEDSSTLLRKSRKKCSLTHLPELEPAPGGGGGGGGRRRSAKMRRACSLHCWLPAAAPRRAGGAELAVEGSAIVPELKPRAPTMSERDLTRHHTPRLYLRC